MSPFTLAVFLVSLGVFLFCLVTLILLYRRDFPPDRGRQRTAKVHKRKVARHGKRR